MPLSPVSAALPPHRPATPGTVLRQLGFRSAAIYLVLHNLEAFLRLVPGSGRAADRLELGGREAAAWVGHRLLGITREIPTALSGSSDMTSDWIRTGSFAVIAVVVAVLWTMVGRGGEADERLRFGVRVGLRYALGAAMLIYGGMKILPPTQFPAPSLAQLTQTLGEFSPQGLLWKFMGFSPQYVRFIGVGEAVAGALLFFRRTTLLGALITAAIMTNVVMLNLCYDVGVKLYSGHLLLMALWLIAPDLPRLTAVFLRNRAVAAADDVLPWRDRRGWLRAVMALKLLVVLGAFYRAGGSQVENLRSTTAQFGASPPELRGIWTVESFERDGQPVPALLTDRSRWQTLIFGDYRAVLMRRGDGQRGGFWLVQRGGESGAFLFERPGGGAPPMPVAIRLPEPGVMQLETRLDGAALKVALRRVDETKFPLLSRGFHWITEVPFNR